MCLGNASQVSDGAAAVLMGRRFAVEALGLPVLGILRAGAVVGVPPDVMGIGPAYAIPAALEKAGRWTRSSMKCYVTQKTLGKLPTTNHKKSRSLKI